MPLHLLWYAIVAAAVASDGTTAAAAAAAAATTTTATTASTTAATAAWESPWQPHAERRFECLTPPSKGGRPAKSFDQGLANEWTPYRSGTILSGTTYWHNQWLSLGHVPMEMTMLKAIRSPQLNVSRVVVQRVVDYYTPVAREPWYDGLFATLAKISYHDLVVYLRFKNDTARWYPRRYGSSGGGGGDRGALRRSGRLCFERAVLQSHHNWPDASTAQHFVAAARDIAGVAESSISIEEPAIVLLALRTHDREMDRASEDELRRRIRRLAPGMRVVTLRQEGRDTTFRAQVRAVTSARVVISTHGAFETNMMWLGPATKSTAAAEHSPGAVSRGHERTYIELRGDYMYTSPSRYRVACLYFELLAKAFNVQLRVVRVPALLSHRQARYALGSGEIEEVARVVERVSGSSR